MDTWNTYEIYNFLMDDTSVCITSIESAVKLIEYDKFVMAKAERIVADLMSYDEALSIICAKY